MGKKMEIKCVKEKRRKTYEKSILLRERKIYNNTTLDVAEN